MASSTTNQVSLKLLVDTKSQKVLFAEAGKDFVDFLFYLLTIPVATVIRLVTEQGMVGCLGDLYESVRNLSDTYYFEPFQNKNSLLKPDVFASCASVPRLLPNSALSARGRGYVKEVVTYMIMDDLVVAPMSSISSINLLKKFNVKEVGALEEKLVKLGTDEGVLLLKASLQSKTVLTDVFLGKKASTSK